LANVPPCETIDTPGIRIPSSNMLRPVGSRVMASASITRCRVVLWTSTMGASPVTVIVSSTRADPHLCVDRRRKGTGQGDAVAFDGIESGETERDPRTPRDEAR
jgi:hypothetical protein